MRVSTFVIPLLLAYGQIDTVTGAKDTKSDKDLVVRFLKGDKDAQTTLFGSEAGFRKRKDLFVQISKSRTPRKKLSRALFAIMDGKKARQVNKKRVSGLLGLLKVEELEAIAKIPGGCTLIGAYLGQINRNSLGKLSNTRCILGMLKGAFQANKKGEFVVNIPADWISPKVIRSISNSLNYATPAFIRVLSNDYVDYAKYIEPSTLPKMSKSQLTQLAPNFLAKIPELLMKDITKAIHSMSDNAFSEYKEAVSLKNAKAMSKAQVQKFNSKHPETRCSLFPIGHLSDEIFGAVDNICLLSYLRNKKLPAIGRKWALVGKDWLDGVSDDSLVALRHIKDEDKKFIPSATWNSMLSKPQVCGNIVGAGIFRDQVISAGGECFAKLRDTGLMTKILLNLDVSNDIFAYANKKTINRIQTTVGGKRIDGFQILQHMRAESSKKEAIINSISTKMDHGVHACAAIKDVDIIHKVKEFAAASPDCFAAMDIEIGEDDYKRSPCLLNVLSPEEAIKMYSGKWSSIAQATLSALLKRGAVADITKEVFMKINLDALPAFTDEFVIHLPYLSEIPKERLNRFADDAFALFDSDRFFANIGFDKVTDQQLPHISTKITQINRRITAKFSFKDVKNLSGRFAKLSALQLEAVPTDAWAAVTEKIFSEIAPESLTKVTAMQMNKMEEKTRLALTARQAELIGRDTDPKSSPILSFRPLLDKLNKDTKAILEKRFAIKEKDLEAGANAVSPSSIITVIVLVAIALLF